MSEPKTREQFYWAKLGGQDVELPVPKTRTQEFMKNAAERLAEAGGGLPDPSEYEDGAVLIKVGGEWKAQSGYGYESAGAFESITWDGTYDESELYFGNALKLSDEHPTADELIGATVSYTLNGEIGSKVIDSSMLDNTFGLLQVIIRLDEQSPYIIQLMILDEEYEGVPVGTYVNITGAENIMHFTSLTAPSSVTTIDPKFIPRANDEFVVQFTAGQGITADKTPDEVFEALGAGKLVKGILSGDVSYFGAAGFTFFGVDDNSLYVQSIVPNDDAWSYKIYTATLTPDE